jgi:hypothetical protein
MTVRELMDVASAHPWLVLGYFALPSLIALIAGWAHRRNQGGESPWRYLYAVLVYLVCVPGLLAAVITAYTLFFTGESLLDANLLVYVLPIVSMVVTLVLIHRNAPFARIPGFDRLSGLMLTIAASFVIALAVSKTRIWLFFGASIWMLFVLAAIVFAVLMWGGRLMSRSRSSR